MPHVVALEFEPSASFSIWPRMYSISAKVFLEDSVFLIPSIFGFSQSAAPLRNPFGYWMVMEKFTRSHVQRAHLGFGQQGISEAFLDRHIGTAASRDIDDRACTFCQSRTNLPEVGRISRRPSVLAVSGMDMDDRGSSLGCPNRTVNNLGWSDGKILRHGRSVNGTGNSAANDYFSIVFGHLRSRTGSITER